MAVIVSVAGTRPEAELIVGMLRSHGVKAVLSADDAEGVDPALQAQGVRVLVPDGQEARARLLLQEQSENQRPLNRVQRLIVRFLGGSSER